jgi:FkbM family methyltransferase
LHPDAIQYFFLKGIFVVHECVIRKLRRGGAILWRIRRKCDKIIVHFFLPFLVKLQQGELKLQRLGTDYGGWTVPVNLLNENSICYCVGVGIDASFDFALVEQFMCSVFSFDPTPKAIDYMEDAEYDHSKLRFLPIGVWNQDTELRFYSPANPEETSHSVFDLHGTGKYFTAECRKLSTIMRDLGHRHIDLLKLDIEGAWRKVIQNIVDECLSISILCVELDSPTTLVRVLRVIRMLGSIGFVLVHFEKDNYLFVKKDLL